MIVMWILAGTTIVVFAIVGVLFFMKSKRTANENKSNIIENSKTETIGWKEKIDKSAICKNNECDTKQKYVIGHAKRVHDHKFINGYCEKHSK